jgi:hypothetical protein
MSESKSHKIPEEVLLAAKIPEEVFLAAKAAEKAYSAFMDEIESIVGLNKKNQIKEDFKVKSIDRVLGRLSSGNSFCEVAY